MAVKARSDTITLVRVSDEGISHVWEGTDGLHVSTQAKPSSGSADAGRHILLTALGILLSAEGGKTLMALTGSTASDGGAVTLCDAAGKRRLAVTTAGVTMYAADGTTQVATLAADSTLGSASGKHVVLSGSSGIALMDGTTTLASFTASAAVIGQAAGRHVAVTSGGIALMNGSTTIMNVTTSSIDFGAYGKILNASGQMDIFGNVGVVLRSSNRDASGTIRTDSAAGVGIMMGSDGKQKAIVQADSVLISGTSIGIGSLSLSDATTKTGPVALSPSTAYIDTSVGGVRAWARCGVAGLAAEVKLKTSLPNGKQTTLGTVPAALRPPSSMPYGEVLGVFSMQGAPFSLMVRVSGKGVVTLENNSGSNTPAGWAVGSFCWPL